MSISVIILVLLATLTFVVMGVAVLAQERARQRSFRFGIRNNRESWLGLLRRTTERRLQRTKSGRGLRRQMDNADLHSWNMADTVLIGAVVTLLAAAVSFNIGGPVFLVVVLVLMALGARGFLQRRVERRHSRFIEQLPDLARLLANATSAGLSLRASIGLAAHETQEPTRGELTRVAEELALGSSTDHALERMGDRLPSRELAVLVNVLVIQSRSGGRIVTALRSITEALETRRDLRREVQTLLAGSKATVLAVAFLGAMMVLLVHNTIEGGLRALLGNLVGLILFIVSGALFLLGMWLIKRVTKVEI